MARMSVCIFALVLACIWPSSAFAQGLSRQQWGAPVTAVSHEAGNWLIRGKKTQVVINESDLGITIDAGPCRWVLVPSSAKDMLVSSGTEQFFVRLADAKKIQIEPYDTGFKSGVKISLGDWKRNGKRLDLNLTI